MKSLILCVCGESFWLVGAFKAFEARCFEAVARVPQGCPFEVSRVFQGSFKVLSVFMENFKVVSKKCKWCFEEDSRVFQGSFREIPWSFQKSSMGVKERLKGIPSSCKDI